MNQTTRRFAACLGMALATMAMAGGCGSSSGGPDVTVRPQYQPTSQFKGAEGKGQAVAVNVIDARQEKGRMTSDGREVLAEGDKGKVYLQEPVTTVLDASVKAALQSAGFKVAADAPVVLDVSLIDLPVEAYQFTHWGLPTERGSTVDAVGVLLPGPVRETKASANVSVFVHKPNTRWGLSENVKSSAANKSKDSSVVQQTVSQSISGAVEQAVSKAAADIDVVNRTPATAAAVQGREAEVARLQDELKALNGQLDQHRTALSDKEKALADLRQERDKEKLSLGNERQELEKKLADVEQSRRKLADEKSALGTKTDAESGKALARIHDEEARIQQQSGKLAEQNNSLAQREQSLASREKGLALRLSALEDEAQTNKTIRTELEQRQGQMREFKIALEEWERALVSMRSGENIRPPDAVAGNNPPHIVVMEPYASRVETASPRVAISGVASDDRRIVLLRARINEKVRDLEAGDQSAEPAAASLAYRKFSFDADLKEGTNNIVIEAFDDDNALSSRKLTVVYRKAEGLLQIVRN